MDVSEIVARLRELAESRDPNGRETSRAELIGKEDYVVAVRLASNILSGMQSRSQSGSESKGPRSKSGFQWSETEEALMVKSFDEGRSITEIAAMLNRSASSVNSRLMRLGKVFE